MNNQEKNSARSLAFMMNFIHVVLGIVIIVLALISFLRPEDHMLLFPVIFLLASVLQGANGWYNITEGRRAHKKTFWGWALMLIAFILFALSIISAVSIWR